MSRAWPRPFLTACKYPYLYMISLPQKHETTMTVVVQNLQKTSGLASRLVHENNPDVLLSQEINLSTEHTAFRKSTVTNTSKQGYGTAIYAKDVGALSNIHRVRSPYTEIGGLIFKKTVVATCKQIQFVSFHGYNGQPMKNVAKLRAHVEAVLSVLDKTGPSIFAGDFNTWSYAHVDAIQEVLTNAGFQRSFEWPYPGRETPLDYAFTRGVVISKSSIFSNESDHNGAVLEIALLDADPVTS